MSLSPFRTLDAEDEGVRLSWWWGRAYRRYERDETVLTIIPLNFFVGWWVSALLPMLRRGYPDRLSCAVEAAYRQGFHDGMMDEIGRRHESAS